MPDKDGKLTREERIELLRKRQKKDGTPFAKHEGPRNKRKVSADGLAVALAVLDSDEQKVKVLQSFGPDGRQALKALVAQRPELTELMARAFPRRASPDGNGRPLATQVRATEGGHAVISGFKAGHAVGIKRNEDGSVLLTQSDLFIPKREVKAEA